MQLKYHIKNKKIYLLLTLLFFGLVSAQTLQSDRKSIKLDDQREIQVDEQTMEDHFFFEIDNPNSFERPVKPQSEFENGFENLENSNNNSSNRLQAQNTPVNDPSQDYGPETSREIRRENGRPLSPVSSGARNQNGNGPQSFDLNQLPGGSAPITPNNNQERNQILDLDQYIYLSNEIPREQSSKDQKNNNNSNNNNININLYNLTNLLDQLFLKNKNGSTKNGNVRTPEWEEAFRNILKEEALSIVKRPSNDGIGNFRLEDFIIKLPILYKLIYGDRQIVPLDKPNDQKTDNAISDNEGYYKKSVDLLTNILRAFPDINNSSIQVLIVTNNIVESTTPNNSNKEKEPDYYEGVDPRYQQEFEGIKRKYNYNIGLELAQIKNLFAEKKYSLVLKKLHQLESLEPYNTRVKNIIGSAYYKIGFYEFAQQYWLESLRLNPNQPLVEAYLSKIAEYGEDTSGDIIETPQ